MIHKPRGFEFQALKITPCENYLHFVTLTHYMFYDTIEKHVSLIENSNFLKINIFVHVTKSDG